MGHPQTEKAHSRERILRRAAEQARRLGLDATHVGKRMPSVGRTHDGFGKHGGARSDLLAPSRALAAQARSDALPKTVRHRLLASHPGDAVVRGDTGSRCDALPEAVACPVQPAPGAATA